MIKLLIILAIAAAILFVLYILALRGRKNHPGLETLRKWSYAHRGLHGNGVPENSMAAFRLALEAGYGIELDVHLLKDGGLGVMHDSNMKRTAGVERKLEDLTTEELTRFHLESTEETIPDFHDVLKLFNGKAPLIIELKSDGNNAAQLSKTVCELLDTYEGPYCLESFDPRCVLWIKKHRPEMIRGQLAENFVIRDTDGVPFILRWVMTKQVANFITKPDFIAYRFEDRVRLGNRICRNFWGLQGVSWTIKTKENYDTAVKEGWIPIFEGIRPSADAGSHLVGAAFPGKEP